MTPPTKEALERMRRAKLIFLRKKQALNQTCHLDSIGTAGREESLRTALEREGDKFDPSGYAYVTVGEGSNPAALESQNPLASEHPPFDDRKSAEKEKQAAHGAGTSGLRGSQKGKDFLQSSLRNHDEWIENTYATGESIPKKEGGTSTFLDDLSQHISIPIEDESVPCKRLKSKKETIQEVPITPNQDPLKLVAQQLGVDELRAMLQAAL
ncbi:uncharacterized protein LOC134205209 isoform X2 [Armigeres subalbatus]|uniref:uncharacterized protein LOC134205209 isoform X2 n=1 Tax=Armigeres subalbatus TaxID=124917 RepID=UPI002ED3A8CA